MADDTVIQQDSALAGKPDPALADKGQDTSPKTYSKADVDKMVSDLKADFGRKLQGARQESESAVSARLKAAEERAAALEAEREQAELDAVKADPVRLTAVQRQQEIRRERARIEQEKLAFKEEQSRLKEDLEAGRRHRTFEKAKVIAADFPGVDPGDLVELTDGNEDRMKALAKKLASGGATAGTGAQVHKPDSGATLGGKGEAAIVDAFIANPNDPAIQRAYMQVRTRKGY